MKRALLAAVVVFAASHAASAGTLLLPNGGFETNPAPVNGFTQTISNWTVSMSGTPDAALPSTEYSGLFTSFGKFSTAPQGNQFVLLTNLGGSGVVTLTSGGVGNNLFLSDRMIAFNFAYLSNDPSGNFQHDKFSVHSMNYRSVVILGRARVLADPIEKTMALRCFTNHIVPGRWEEVRPPSDQELKATTVLALALQEVSAKIRTGGPVEDPADLARPVWAGVVPLRTVTGEPIPAPDLAAGTPGLDLGRWAR